MPNRPSAAAVLLVAVAATAHADIVDMHFSGVGRGLPVQISIGQRSMSTFAGQLMHEVTSADTQQAYDAFGGLEAYFCTDLFQTTSSRSLPYTVTDLTGVPDSQPMSASTASAVRSLFASADQFQFETDAPNDLAAAFQLALWEVVSDFDTELGRGSLDIEQGWFSASSRGGQPLPQSVHSRLDTLFDAVASGAQFDGDVFAMRSSSAQDQVTAIASIPTSGSLASFSLGLALMFGRRRR